MSNAAYFARWNDRTYFGAVAWLFVALTAVGFVRTFYFSKAFGQPAPSPLIVIHGLVMTGWILLYAVQTWLVAARRVQWHKWLGWAGVAFAVLIPPLGFLATTSAALREVRAHSAYVVAQLNVLGLELTQICLFVGFVLGAVLLRRRTDWHKRFMTLATLCILPNAIVRLSLLVPLAIFSTNAFILVLWVIFVALVIGVDVLRAGCLHQAYKIGAAIAVGGLCLAQFVSMTDAWRTFVTPLLH